MPTGSSSTWVNRTGIGSPTNVTAKVNFYGSPIREWIIGPGFLCTPYTYLYFDVALTAYNSTNSYPNGMATYDSLRIFYSIDCGTTWNRLTAYGKNSSFTNSLQTLSINLSQFSGNGLAIAFQAFRETTSSNDYDLHLDNILIKNEFPYDLSVVDLVSPVEANCYGNEAVTVRVKNSGLNTIDFSQEPLTVEVTENNVSQYHETLIVSSGTLVAGNHIDVHLPSVIMSNQGVYNFNVLISHNLDSNLANNVLQKNYTVNNPDLIISGDTLICEGDSALLSAVASAYGNVLISGFNDTLYNIPDNLGNGVISSITLNLPTSVLASSVLEVIIDSLTHTYVGDLKMELYAPNNSYITLVNRRGSNGDNYINTVFTMNATTPITSGLAPFTGQFLPEESFANLTGTANGTWRLKVMDLGIGDVGKLHKWTIKILAPNSIVSYSWSNGQNSPTIIVSPTSTQTYTLTVTDANGCTTSNNFTVSIGGQAGSINLGNDTILCVGQSLTLDAGSNFTNYLWSNGQQTQSIVVSASGTYWVHATDACGTIADTITVNFNPLPDATLSDYDVCANQTLTLSLSNNCATYLWSNGSIYDSLSVPTHTPGIFSYQVTVTDCNGCTNTGSSTVTVYESPVVNLGMDTLICQNQTLLLDAGNHDLYLWSNGSTSQTVLVDASQYPVGTYVYSVTVTNANGCSTTDDIIIIIDPCTSARGEVNNSCRIYPNPAKEWIVLENLPVQSHIEVINQKGQKVYEFINKYSNEVFNIQLLPTGIYLIKVTNNTSQTFKLIKE